jgi:hypothetical protein
MFRLWPCLCSNRSGIGRARVVRQLPVATAEREMKFVRDRHFADPEKAARAIKLLGTKRRLTA